MPVANSLVFKISGNVAYADGSNGPFESSHQAGILISPFPSDSTDNFDELYGDESVGVNALIALLTNKITLAFTTTNRTKTVSDWTMEVSGRVSYDDGTNGDWTVQYANGAQNNVGGATHLTAALAVTAFKTDILNAIKQLANNSSIAP